MALDGHAFVSHLTIIMRSKVVQQLPTEMMLLQLVQAIKGMTDPSLWFVSLDHGEGELMLLIVDPND